MSSTPSMETNIYLDIDGVLLANDLNPANYAEEFLVRVLTDYPNSTYWLTTHCKGDASTAVRHIEHLFSKETVYLMQRIKPTNWLNAKTEAIDFTKPFLWFDDDCFADERAVLSEHGVLDNWIDVRLHEDEDQLQQFLISFPLPIEAVSEQ